MINGFKGFNKDMQCRGFQFEVGGEYEENTAKCCESGFHFCENPMDVFGYYPPSDSRFCQVEGDGEIDRRGDDSKVATSKIKIGLEIGLSGLIQAGVKFILEKVDFANAKESNTGYRSAATNTGYRSAATNTGDRSAATNTGDRSAATNTGYRSAATNTGDQSAATVEGKGSVAIATGYEGKAMGALGCAIVVAERDDDYNLIGIKSAMVDGETIKADIYYTLVGDNFIEAE